MTDEYGQIDMFGGVKIVRTANGASYSGCSWSAAWNFATRHSGYTMGNVLLVDGRVELLRTNEVSGLCPETSNAGNQNRRAYAMPY
jgi:prepilin-type processing-associated H-X9-DG protein